MARKTHNHVLTCHLTASAHMQTHKHAHTYHLRGVNRGVWEQQRARPTRWHPNQHSMLSYHKKMNQHWCWHESSCYCNLLKTKHVRSPNLHASNMNKKTNTKKKNPILFYVLYAFWTYANNPDLSDWYSAEHHNPPFAFFCLPDCENYTSVLQIQQCYFEIAVLDRCVSPNRFMSRTKPKWKGKRCVHTGKSVLSG